MKTIKFILFFLIIFSNLFASSNEIKFFHETPTDVLKGEDIRIEVMLTDASSGLYNIRLFYRQFGEDDYQVIRMQRDGYLYYASLNTGKITSGQMEYYIGFENGAGVVETLPEESAQMNPYVVHVTASNQTPTEEIVEILILAPEPDEVVPNNEVAIVASFLSEDARIDYSKTKLIVDGNNVTNLAEISDGIIIYSPDEVRRGAHNIELTVYDNSDNILGKKEWSFRASGSIEPSGGFTVKGSYFLEDRYKNVAQSDDNFFRTGGELYGKYENLDYRARLVISTEEANDRQPVNRYSAQLRYNFSDWNRIYLNGGDFTPHYNPLTLQDKRVRGIQAGIAMGFFTFDFVSGQINRGIEGITSSDSLNVTGTGQDTTIYTSIPQGGIYEQNILAFRPGFRFGEHVSWNLNLINSKEEENSIEKGGGNVKEALIVGTDLNLNFDHKRIIFDASVQASVNNSDAGGEEVTYDDLVKMDSSSFADNSTAEAAYNFLESTGFLSLTGGLNPYPSIAMQFETRLRYFGNYLRIKYFDIASEFESPGNPYLLKDISGFHIMDNIRLVDNQVYFNVHFRNYTNNKSEDELATNHSEIGASVSYYPRNNYPSLTIGYSNINRSNDVPVQTDTTVNRYLFREDNSTKRLSFNTSYNFDFQNIKNTISLNITNYAREDNINENNQSDFTLFGFGLRNKFSFPLVTTINYSQTESIFGTGDTEASTKIQRIFLAGEYKLANLSAGDMLKPFIRLSFQNVELAGGDYNRNNYTLGLAYQNPIYGILSLRFDQITYSEIDYDDSILNARYEYSF